MSEEEETSSGELYSMSTEVKNPADIVSLMDESEVVQPITYERIFMDLDDGLLKEMEKFADPKLQKIFKKKTAGSKDVKSGKVIHEPSLREVAARGTFYAYLNQTGFEWLLINDMPDVPVVLTREFFTTFHFRITTDLDEPSVRFRVYGMELEMSLTEWTVRMRICTLDQAVSAEWRSREIGIPKCHFDFDAQVAWESLTHPHSKKFQATKSKSYHFSNPILRLVQVYLGYNLLGHTNSSSTTTFAELYFMMCVKAKKKVHLGFWTAYQCHLIATHPIRNLTICHLLGTFVRNSLQIQIAPGTTLPDMCKPPTLFDLNFFIRTSMVYMREGRPRFYRVGRNALLSGQSTVNAGNRAEEEEWRKKMEAVMARLIKENKEQASLIEQVGHQMDKVIKMMEGLVHDIQETKEVQVYTIDPQAYKELTGRDQPEGLTKKHEIPPTTSKEKKASPVTGKKEGKKGKRPPKTRKMMHHRMTPRGV